MSFFRRGFDSYGEDLEQEDQKFSDRKMTPYPFTIQVDKSKDGIILDDTGFRFHEHNYFNQMTKKSKSFTCKQSVGETCFLCESDKKSPSLVTVMTIKDLTGYIDKNGNRKGQGDLKLFKLKRDASKRINNLRATVAAMKSEQYFNANKDTCLKSGLDSAEKVAERMMKKGDVLKNVRIKASRIGIKSEGAGDEFSFLSFVKPENLEKTDVPFNYEEIFAVVADDEIKRELMELYMGNPPFPIPGYSNGPSQSNDKGNQQRSGNHNQGYQQQGYGQHQQDQQPYGQQQRNSFQSQRQQPPAYEEAPNWDSTDIPF